MSFKLEDLMFDTSAGELMYREDEDPLLKELARTYGSSLSAQEDDLEEMVQAEYGMVDLDIVGGDEAMLAMSELPDEDAPVFLTSWG